jgi:hypothetical protein
MNFRIIYLRDKLKTGSLSLFAKILPCRQQLAYFGLGVCFIVLIGCLPVCNARWKSIRLAEFQINDVGVETTSRFRAPIDGVVFLSLVFDRNSQIGNAGIPNLPLILELSISDCTTKGSLTSRLYVAESMQYANWHKPKTTLILGRTNDKADGVVMRNGQVYEIMARVIVPVAWFTNQIELYADWVEP